MKTTRNILMGLMLLILATSAKTVSKKESSTDNRTSIQKYGLYSTAKMYGLNFYLDPNKFYVVFLYKYSSTTNDYSLAFSCGEVINGSLVPAVIPTNVSANIKASYVVGSYSNTQTENIVLNAGQHSLSLGTYPFTQPPLLTTNYISPTVVPYGSTYAGRPIEYVQFDDLF
ncbi:hypothetical protein DJ568_09380 [Mucilaginibacter hurinus]|uniref:Uncharacterized protein n=1 Tax=Mucilaginibacter hurinus TaxID=2201324 RepID=A0A367GPJ8_9SPHI|nr:hypothetical protein [Mucilaginibacter hurinus]RCH55379.1 hypothetical protein DJ568_09380 [Mucilaginibacter hurinus]